MMPLKIWVLVKPQARQAKVEKLSEGEYRVSVREAAREGKANEAVVESLAKHFSVPKSSVSIVRGEKSKRKLVEIA